MVESYRKPDLAGGITTMTGAIFDFNGTMFFDEAFQERSWREFLGQKTGRDVTDAEFQEYIHGRNADVSLPYFLQRSPRAGSKERVWISATIRVQE